MTTTNNETVIRIVLLVAFTPSFNSEGFNGVCSMFNTIEAAHLFSDRLKMVPPEARHFIHCRYGIG